MCSLVWAKPLRRTFPYVKSQESNQHEAQK